MATKKRPAERVMALILVLAVMLAAIPSGLGLPSVFAEDFVTDRDSFTFSLKGKGTEAEPFLISSQKDLENMRDAVNIGHKENGVACDSAYYKLTADIELDVKSKVYTQSGSSATYTGWKPIGRYESFGSISSSVTFSGTFDGCGHTISGMFISLTNNGRDYYRGLFGYNLGTIKNLKVVGEMNKVGWFSGLIAGVNGGTVENCYASGYISCVFSCGGLVGCNSMTSGGSTGIIRNCYSDVTSDSTPVGAIAGYSPADGSSVIENCYYSGSLSALPNKQTLAGSTKAEAEALASGEITWLLQDAQKDKSKLVWKQDIGSDSTPVLNPTDDNDTDRVCKVTCMMGTTELGHLYVNSGEKLVKPETPMASEGYTMGDRWFTDEDMTDAWDFENRKVSGDITLYSERVPLDYTITLDVGDGVISDDNWTNNGNGTYSAKYNIETPDFTLPQPELKNYEFMGWTSKQEDDVTGEAQKEVTIAKGTVGDREFTAFYKDRIAPEIDITLGEHTWHILHPAPEFDLFFSHSQTISISAKDNETGDLAIAYYISGKALTQQELSALKDWKTYTSPFTIDPEKSVIVYAKVTDPSGNVSYASSTGLVFEVTPPAISGAADGSTHCEDVTFTVTDPYLDKITVNGEVYYDSKAIGDEPVEDGPSIAALTAEAANGTQTVKVSHVGATSKEFTLVAVDKVGNSSSVTVTLLGGHSRLVTIVEHEIYPDCDDPGLDSYNKYCFTCGRYVSHTDVEVEPLGHKFDESKWEDIATPDCDNSGLRQNTCLRCKMVISENLDPKGHDWETDYTIDEPATCTKPGSKSIHCKNCKAVERSEMIPVLPHEPMEAVMENKVPATCTSDGSYDLVIRCKNCAEVLSEEPIIVPTTGHDFSDGWEEKTAASCESHGMLQRTCKVCGHIETSNIDPKGHDWNELPTTDKEPDCTTNGSQSIHCKNCEATKDNEDLPALGHDWSDWETVDMPECDDSGTEEHYCKVCGVHESRGLDPTGHKWQLTPTVDVYPTCTTEGSQSIHCENCKATTDDQIIPALGHSWGEWHTVNAPQCEAEGLEERSCEVCGLIQTNGLHAAGHQWASQPTVDKQPSCLEDGSQSIHCENCDAVKDSESIPAAGHHTPVLKDEKPATPTEDGYTGDTVCDVCGELLEKGEVIPKTAGTFQLESSIGENAPETQLNTDKDSVFKAALTDEEISAWEQGADVKIVLSVTDAASTVTDEEKSLIADAAGSEFTVGAYLNIDLIKYIDSDKQLVTETNSPISVTVKVPESLLGENRTFVIIRIHNGEAEILNDTDSADGTITFETDKFSVYAIAYKQLQEVEPAPEQPKPEEPAPEQPTPEKPAPEEPTPEQPGGDVPDKDDSPNTGSAAASLWLAIISLAATVFVCKPRRSAKSRK